MKKIKVKGTLNVDGVTREVEIITEERKMHD